MKAHELRDLSLSELEVRLKESKDELQKLEFNHAVAGQVESPANMKLLRREIARLHTVIKEKPKAATAKEE